MGLELGVFAAARLAQAFVRRANPQIGITAMHEAHSQLPPVRADSSRHERATFNWWRWFWIVFLVVSLAYAWHCFYVPSNGIAWASTFNSAQQQASESGKPIILFFTGDWCVPCRIMKRNVWADRQVAAAVNAGFIPVMIDVDDPEAVAVVDRYAVRGTPITFVTDPQGNVLRYVAGGMGKAEFLELLGKAK